MDENFEVNVKFPTWKNANETLAKMARDIGAHLYLQQTDPECSMITDPYCPVCLLIPWQWFNIVPGEHLELFRILYNEFSSEVFYDIDIEKTLEKFIGKSMDEQTRYEARRLIFLDLEDYEKRLLQNWDGNFKSIRNIRDKFLDKMGCLERPLNYFRREISDYVKENDKIWVVQFPQ